MNRKLKYSSIFLLFTLLLILAGGIAAATDVDNNDNTDLSDNTIADTVGDYATSTQQPTSNNNIETKTIKEVDYTYTDTTTTSEAKELVKNDKNLKGFDYTITPTLTPNVGQIGDKITATFSGGSYFGTRSHSYTVSMDGTTIKTGSVAPKSGYAIEFNIPETTAGDHTISFHVYYSAWNNRGSATLTVLSSAVNTKI